MEEHGDRQVLEREREWNNMGRPRRRDLETETDNMGRTWMEVQDMAEDKRTWHELVEGLYFTEGRKAEGGGVEEEEVEEEKEEEEN